MSSPALRAEIRNLVESFTTELEAIVRRAALETVAQALGGGTFPAAAPRTSGGARTGRKSPNAVPALPRKTPSKAPSKKEGSRVRRSAEQIEATADRIVAHVEKHPGARSEDIRSALGLAKNEWTLTVKRLTETGRLVSKGEKRATVYFTRAPSKLGVIRRPGRGAAPSEPSGGESPDAS